MGISADFTGSVDSTGDSVDDYEVRSPLGLAFSLARVRRPRRQIDFMFSTHGWWFSSGNYYHHRLLGTFNQRWWLLALAKRPVLSFDLGPDISIQIWHLYRSYYERIDVYIQEAKDNYDGMLLLPGIHAGSSLRVANEPRYFLDVEGLLRVWLGMPEELGTWSWQLSLMAGTRFQDKPYRSNPPP